MQLHGNWIDRDGAKGSGSLWAWGEWEPESDVVRRFSASPSGLRRPRFLWNPYHVPKVNYRGLHNTDPFIFGERFLYSNCGQTSSNKAGLKHLAQGSVIAFGSGKEINGRRRWMLDTVLVVRDFIDYEMCEARTELKGWASDTFLEVVGGPLSDYDGETSCSGACGPIAGRLRLYRGATPDDPVEGMFSFFPAVPAGGEKGFPRPLIDLPGEYFNPGSWQAPKGLGFGRSGDELSGQWKRLVRQVHDAGLVLGTHADLPERRVK